MGNKRIVCKTQKVAVDGDRERDFVYAIQKHDPAFEFEVGLKEAGKKSVRLRRPRDMAKGKISGAVASGGDHETHERDEIYLVQRILVIWHSRFSSIS